MGKKKKDKLYTGKQLSNAERLGKLGVAAYRAAGSVQGAISIFVTPREFYRRCYKTGDALIEAVTGKEIDHEALDRHRDKILRKIVPF